MEGDDIRERVAAWWGRAKPGLSHIGHLLTTERAYQVYAATLLSAIAVFTLWVSNTLVGTTTTVIYALLFCVGLGLLPGLVGFFGVSFTGGMRKISGALHFRLAQLAFGGSYLVQTDDGWQICPGKAEQVYFDGEWQDVKGGDKRKILGKSPFGLLRYKEDDTWRELRSDALPVADGGEGIVPGIDTVQVTPQARDWRLDLRRAFARGLRQIADISAIEKAEEIAMRQEARDSRIGGWEPIIGSLIGLLLGILTAWVMTAG